MHARYWDKICIILISHDPVFFTNSLHLPTNTDMVTGQGQWPKHANVCSQRHVIYYIISAEALFFNIVYYLPKTDAGNVNCQHLNSMLVNERYSGSRTCMSSLYLVGHTLT